MLEYVAGNDEIETAVEVLGRSRNIESRLLMKKGVRIVEFVAEPPGIVIRIGEPYPGEIATPLIPTIPSGNPSVSFFQVSPPSVDLKKPSAPA